MMKESLLTLLLMIGLAVLPPSSLGQTQDKKVERTGSKPTSHERATEGSTVWVLVNVVKPDKREQFEKFVFEIFWPGAKKLSAAYQQAFKQTRVLKPVEADKDGNYPYLFIMDPIVPSVDYSLFGVPVKMYGEQKETEYMDMFIDAMASPQQIKYTVVQSRF
jgi:hypothetical protein